MSTTFQENVVSLSSDFLWESDDFLRRTDPHGGLALRFHNLSQFSAPHTAHTVIARCDATPELLRRVELTLMTIFFYRIIASESVLRLLGEISPQFHYLALCGNSKAYDYKNCFE